eukprot:CAMPEP_0178449176 /NCGR_PEP_ID=MMETSP0689_2-20121128/42391_1 /TAXON_ID=160604 /ORGANISM="Amphidinium massartii, Strain CS-259" /LENGTH=507 /DNA_ID=CAMNT_0020074437 /DNA_START=88 /DNA_END=1611 /DNA_ORIENTATION=-
MPAPVIEALPIKDAYVATFKRFKDDRGHFNELFNREQYPDIVRGSNDEGAWKQVSTSLTMQVGTIRGLHLSPYNKFCSVLSGAIYDVIVDVRKDSPTFMKWCATVVSEENCKQVHVPAYCLHGVMAIEPGTRLLYLQGGTFQPALESDCTPFEELFGIHWPLPDMSKVIVSERDRNAPAISADNRLPELKGRRRPKRVLVIGASSQVGCAVVKEMERNGYLVYGTHSSSSAPGRHTMCFDLEAAAKVPEKADELLNVMRPDVVVLCPTFVSAETAASGVESHKEHTYAVNVAGPEAVALAAKKIGAKLVVYYTENVWDGTFPMSPTPVIGEHAAIMERSVIATCSSCLVLRTTGVYGPEPQGQSFLYQLCRKLRLGERVEVASDQLSSPIYNKDLATFTRMLLEVDAAGIFNLSGVEVLSRYDFAIAAAKALRLDARKIMPCLSLEEAPTQSPTLRPLSDKGMSMAKAINMIGARDFRLRSVQEAIADWQGSQSVGDAPLLVATARL